MRRPRPFSSLRRVQSPTKSRSQPWKNLYRTLDPFARKEAIETKLRAVLRYQIRTPLFKAA